MPVLEELVRPWKASFDPSGDQDGYAADKRPVSSFD
jgi:hypothetical protein